MTSPDAPTPSLNVPRVLVIAGMHRSGTSLVAHWMAQCGLNVGEELLKDVLDNPMGHYEDRSFLSLHKAILQDNGLDYLVTNDHKLTIGADRSAQAQELIRAREKYAQWGWKEPRTCLFLDFWHSLLPDMKLLVVYREYAQVADSLMRRAYKREVCTENLTRYTRRLAVSRKLALLRRIPGFLPLFNKAERLMRPRLLKLTFSFLNLKLLRIDLKTWNRYNQDILSFLAAHPDCGLVIHIDDLSAVSKKVIDYLNQEWGFNLQQISPDDVSVEGMLHQKPMRIRHQVSKRVVPACVPTYRALDGWRERTLHRIGSLSGGSQQ